jgi:hypothetical protein
MFAQLEFVLRPVSTGLELRFMTKKKQRTER